MFDDDEVEVRDFTVVLRAERVPAELLARSVIPQAMVALGIRAWCVASEEALAWVLEALRELGAGDDDVWVAHEDGLDRWREDDDDGGDDDEPMLVTPWLRRRLVGRRVYVSRAPASSTADTDDGGLWGGFE